MQEENINQKEESKKGENIIDADIKDLKRSLKKKQKKRENDEELIKLKELNQQLTDNLLRANAEMDNIRKRADKRVEESTKYSIANFAKEMLTIIDNLERAAFSIPEEELANNPLLKNINEGVAMTHKEFIHILNKFGIKSIVPQPGEAFNHDFHQAVANVDSKEYESNCIVNIMQKGYMIYDRLLRPAMVTVAK